MKRYLKTALMLTLTGLVLTGCGENASDDSQNGYEFFYLGVSYSITSFTNRDGVTELELPRNTYTRGHGNYNVIEIGARAFQDNSLLEKVFLPDTISKVGDLAFTRCSSMTSINLGSVTSIGNQAFLGCESLSSMKLSENIQYLGYGAFSGCRSMVEMDIPDSLNFLRSYTFKDCSSLLRVSLPDSITSIGKKCFQGCSSLTNLVLPSSLTYIGQDIVDGCSSFSSIYYKGSLSEWNNIQIEESNTALSTCDIYCYSETAAEGKYWHYVDDVPTPW